MELIRVASTMLLGVSLVLPARADFKYTNTSKMTGGSLMGAMKLASAFSRKNGQDPLQGITTTYYLKGNRLRTDNSDGTIQIIDLDARRITSIDSQKKTYASATFDEIKAAAQPIQQQAIPQQEKTGQEPKPENPQVTITPKFEVIPGTSNRVILGQQTTETTLKTDIDVQAQNAGQTTSDARDLQSGQPGRPVNGTITMTVDMYVAPSLTGHEELTQFYVRLAKELNWVPPSNIRVDPRMAQGLSELQKNSAALKGFPLLEFVSMGMAVPPGQESPDTTQNATPPPQQDNSASSSRSQVPTSASDAVVKGLGGMFGRKKQQQRDDASSQSSTAAAGQNPAHVSAPNALMEMTIEVTSFSDASLDNSVFEVPAGFTQEKSNPDQILGRQPRK